MNNIYNIGLIANASLSIDEKLRVMVTTIGITLGMMMIIVGILYAIPYIAGQKKFKKGKKEKNK